LNVSQSDRIVWFGEELGIPYELKTYLHDSVTNLAPAKIRGVESNGMILAADAGEDDVRVIFLDGSIPPGSKIR
jgi:tRNA-binding EMAP/Myf-like protein